MNIDAALKLLRGGKDGVRSWNMHRKEGGQIPALSGVDLRKTKLARANFESAVLDGARFNRAGLMRARFNGANLSSADLSKTFLTDTCFDGAILDDANLGSARLTGTSFVGAQLNRANLHAAELNGACLDRASLIAAKLTLTMLYYSSFIEANLLAAVIHSPYELTGTDFTNAKCGNTFFVGTNLSQAKGMHSIRHLGPSSIDLETLIKSSNNIPESFLRGCGLPDAFITSMPSLIGSMEPIQFYSCFISHSSDDKEFARRLYSRMRDEKLRVWFDEEDMKGGRELYSQIDEAIRIHDKLLLVLSETSMASNWVRTEIRRARLAEISAGKRKLFPIRLVDYDAIEKWSLPESTGEDLAELVRQFYIPDFSNWKDHDNFEMTFAKLLRDLKAET